MQKITPFLWFDGKAEDAVNFYCSVFKDAKMGEVVRWDKTGPGPEGSVLTAAFELFGQKFVALNGGPEFKFNEAVSFVINCDNQDEVDYYWDKLTADGGQPSQCGWLKDKFGLSWQVTPTVLLKMIGDKDPAKAGRAMQAMMKMTKLDIATLEKACDGE